jgi:hypothetical protein
MNTKKYTKHERKWMADQLIMIADELKVGASYKDEGASPFEAVCAAIGDNRVNAELAAHIKKELDSLSATVGDVQKASQAREDKDTALMREIQHTLFRWVVCSSHGGWSTHLNDPMRQLACRLGEHLAETRG